MIKLFREYMRDYRKLEGLSRREFSELCGCGFSESTIQKYEAGIQNIPEKNALYIGKHVMGMSEYNILLSSRAQSSRPVVIGVDVKGEELDEEEMFRLLEVDYRICAVFTLEFCRRSIDSFFDKLSAETSITKERLEIISHSYWNPCRIEMYEVLVICNAMGRKFSEVFAVVSSDFLSDQNAIHVAQTLQNYVERIIFPVIQWDRVDFALAEDEVEFLKAMLKTYRQLKLAPK